MNFDFFLKKAAPGTAATRQADAILFFCGICGKLVGIREQKEAVNNMADTDAPPPIAQRNTASLEQEVNDLFEEMSSITVDEQSSKETNKQAEQVVLQKCGIFFSDDLGCVGVYGAFVVVAMRICVAMHRAMGCSLGLIVEVR